MKQKFISILTGLCMLLAPNSAIAAEVFFSPSEHLVTHESNYTTTFVLNTQGENINAVEGVLKVDPGLATSLEISDSGSVVTYWIIRPVWDESQGVVRFSGAIPGGYTGGSGILFSLILPPHSSEPMENAVAVSDFKAYRNDGLGSTASVETHGFSLGDIAGQIDRGIADQLYLNGNRKDDIPPEIFSPQIEQDPNIFNGRWFISFSTTDKQSGIDHYEVQESRTGSMDSGKWITANSPYELQDQELHSFVYVIAVDRQGNERIIKVFPRNPLPWGQRYGKELGAIAILVLAGGAIYYRRRKMRDHKKANSHHSNP